MVAERLGYPHETALTLGRFVAGSSARAKARRLDISDEKLEAEERRAREAGLRLRRPTPSVTSERCGVVRPVRAAGLEV
jgi:hypothetical protein